MFKDQDQDQASTGRQAGRLGSSRMRCVVLCEKADTGGAGWAGAARILGCRVRSLDPQSSGSLSVVPVFPVSSPIKLR